MRSSGVRPSLGKRSVNSQAIYLALGLGLLILLPELVAPFNNDNELFHSMAWLEGHFGRVPYVGVWDQNFPGITFLHRVVISLFGSSPFTFRATDIIAHLLTATLIAVLMARSRGSISAVLASSLYCLDYMYSGYWAAGQRDGFGTLFFLAGAGIYLYTQWRTVAPSKLTSYCCLFVSGVCAGIAISFRPTHGLLAICLGATILLCGDKNSRAEFAFYVAGASGVWLFTGAWLLSHGALAEFWNDTVAFNLGPFTGYRGSVRLLFTRPREIVYDAVLLAWLGHRKSSIRSVFSQKHSSFPPEVFLVVSCYIAAKLSVIVMGKYFISHYDPQSVATSLLAASVISDVVLARSPRMALAFCCAIGIVLVYRIYSNSLAVTFVRNLALGGDGNLHALHTLQPFARPDWETEYDNATRYLLQHGAEGNSIEVWGWSPGLYWRTGCNSSSRFPFLLPLVMKDPSGMLSPDQLQWRNEFVQSLTLSPPKFVVLAKDSMGLNTFYQQSASSLVDSIQGFRNLLQSKYTPDTIMQYWDIYRVRDSFPISNR